ncbi:MAG: Bax inhibitor-1/YccA family protein [Acidimicrobiales bacterium]
MAAPTNYIPVASQDEVVRGEFLVKVYRHLLGAIIAFVAFESLLFTTGTARRMYDLLSGTRGAWLLILGGFMIVSWLATTAAHDVTNPSRQYAGLFGLAGAQALIFAPFLYLVFNRQDGSTTVVSAAILTAVGFGGLSAVAFTTRRDLSFLRPMVMWGMVSGLLLIVAAVLFGLELGVWFSLAMIIVAGASILYQTQAVMRDYPAEAYVGAAVQLFASVMLLFWYVLRLLSQMRN